MHLLGRLLATNIFLKLCSYGKDFSITLVVWIFTTYTIALTQDLLLLREDYQHLGYRYSLVSTSRSIIPGTVNTQDISPPEEKYKPSSIFLADDNDQTKKAVKLLLRDLREYESWMVVGMDCEKKSKRSHRSIPLLLQLATNSGFSALFRINKMEKLAPELVKLLQDAEVWKVGVGIQNDAGDLERRFNGAFKIKGTFDLGYFAEELNYRSRSLKGLAKEVLNAPLNQLHQRGQKWDAKKLSTDQIQYASADAYLGVSLFFEMLDKYVFQKTQKKYGHLDELERADVDRTIKRKFFDKMDTSYNKLQPSQNHIEENNLMYKCWRVIKKFLFRRNNASRVSAV